MKKILSLFLALLIAFPVYAGNSGVFVNGNMVTLGPLKQLVFDNGLTLYQEADNLFSITENSDFFWLYFGGTDVDVLWSDGVLNLRNNEDGVNAIVEIEGKDAGERGELRVLSDGGDKNIAIYHDDTNAVIDASSGNIVLNDAVTFNAGQTKKCFISVKDVQLDNTSPATLTFNGTDGQQNIPSLEFDADGGDTGDDKIFIHWAVPDGYVADSARLNIYWSYDTAETDGDDVVFDMQVNSVAVDETIDAAGTDFTEGDTDIPNADSTNGTMQVTQLNIEVEDIAVDDLVTILFWVDESVSDLDQSGTCDIHGLEIEWESAE